MKASSSEGDFMVKGRLATEREFKGKRERNLCVSMKGALKKASSLTITVAIVVAGRSRARRLCIVLVYIS
jgi:hypothetical protein